MRPRLGYLPLLLAFAGAAATSLAQSTNPADLNVGEFLVASRDLRDPNFAQTVVLLIQYDEDGGAVGLVMNRPTRAPLARVLQEFKEAKGRTDPAFGGGPVEKDTVFSLLRSNGAPEAAERLFDSVYMVRTKPVLEKALAANRDPRTLRVYLGYCGWAAGQLENEVDLGAWHIFRGVAEKVFDLEPESLWSRMIALTERQIAESGRPRPQQLRARQR